MRNGKYFKLFICSILFIGMNYIIYDFISEKEKANNIYIILDANELNEELEDGKVIVYFFKDGCSPCELYKENINRVIEDQNYVVYASNIDDVNDKEVSVGKEYDVKYTPTTIIYDNGEESERKEGYIEYNELLEFTDKYFNNNAELKEVLYYDSYVNKNVVD